MGVRTISAPRALRTSTCIEKKRNKMGEYDLINEHNLDVTLNSLPYPFLQLINAVL